MRVRRFGIRRAIRYFVLVGVSSVLRGTHFFGFKGFLLRLAGYRIGQGAKIVGPIHISTMCELAIGRNSWVGANLTVQGNGVVHIGDNCDLGPDVTFCTGTHEMGDAGRRAGQGRNTRVIVGDGCWLGTRSTLLGDLRVGGAR